MDEINEELNEKSIEKSDNLQVTLEPSEGGDVIEEKPKKVKRQRTQKQIDAFEKARTVRAQKIAEKKLQKEQDKNDKKTKIKEFKKTLKEPLVLQKKEQSPVIPDEPLLSSQNITSNYSPADSGVSIYSPAHQQPQQIPNPLGSTQKEQIVNNYFYYAPPPGPHDPYQQPQQHRERQRPLTPEESSEEEYYEEEIDPPKVQYKYNYV